METINIVELLTQSSVAFQIDQFERVQVQRFSALCKKQINSALTCSKRPHEVQPSYISKCHSCALKLAGSAPFFETSSR